MIREEKHSANYTLIADCCIQLYFYISVGTLASLFVSVFCLDEISRKTSIDSLMLKETLLSGYFGH